MSDWHRTFQFCAWQAHPRLDKYLTLVFPHLSRTLVHKMLESEYVFINHKIAQASDKIRPGDELRVLLPRAKETALLAENIPLHIVFEDADMLVIDKPAGMVVHPTDHGEHVSGTLVNALLHHCHTSLGGINGELRPGLVHRLDKDTSGLIMIAKNDLAMRGLSQQIMAHQVEKYYLVVVAGHLTPSTGSIEAPIDRSLADRKKMSVSGHPQARYALTNYTVLEYWGLKYTLLKARIITGRTHQIRVHFASIGHPVVGDTTYGSPHTNQRVAQLTGLNRQFLHATELTFTHPRDGQHLTLHAPLPPDLEQCKQILKKQSA